VAVALAASGTFAQLLSLAIALILLIDSVTIAALFPLRAREPRAPFSVPLYPLIPALFIAVYVALLVGTAMAQASLVVIALGVLLGVWGLSFFVSPAGTESRSPSPR
jgi:L-asparagine transporter-like permease